MPSYFMSIQEQINRLLWNRRLIVFPPELEKPDSLDYVILKDFTLEDRNYYLFIRDLEERKARSIGVPTEGELMEKAREGGYWGKEEDDIESRADEHIAYLEGEFEARSKFKSRQNIIKLQIDDANAKKQWVQAKKNTIRQNSAEYLAHEIACFKLLRRVVLDDNDEPFIADDKDFLFIKESYPILLYYLVQEMMNEGALDVATLREIARSTEWRLIWTLSRENLPAVFGREVGDFNINHRMLIYWSRVYDSAFESQEPPEKDIIDDDDRFDEWLADRDLERQDNDKNRGSSTSHHQEQGRILDGEYIEKCICGMKQKNAGKGHGERLPHSNECLYGTWKAYSREEKESMARRVYNKNSKMVRKTLDAEQEAVLRRGVVEEQDLRGTKTRQLYGMPTKVVPIKRR